MKLGVNIDHIAVLREARKIGDPDPLMALGICKEAGADQITIHLREDRRHICDYDAKRIIENSQLPVNLECSLNDEIVDIVCQLKPFRATLVPENREEITTEGGLDLIRQKEKLEVVIDRFQKEGIDVSVFIDPDKDMIVAAKELDVDTVEFHTGRYANIYAMLHSNLKYTPHKIDEFDLPREELKALFYEELLALHTVCDFADENELFVAAGHGLNYQNIEEIAKIKSISELNIGQSIIARSVFTGLSEAIKEMKRLV